LVIYSSILYIFDVKKFFKFVMLRSFAKVSSPVGRRCFASGNSSIPAGCYLPKEDVTARVLEVVKRTREFEEVKPSAHFVADLKLDSALRRSLTAELGREFCVKVPVEASEGMLSVEDVVNYFGSHPRAR
jgi:acyl carrier protein